MAKYFGSPFGEIRGSIAGVVASRIRGGIKILKDKNYPRVPGSKREISKAMRGEIQKNKISVKQANEIRCFTIIGRIAVIMKKIIWEAWEPQTRGTKLTGQTKFIKMNCPLLYHSIPDKQKFISKDNKPDFTKIFITKGRLEKAYIEDAHYDKENGIVELKWNSFYYNNAKKDDEAIITLLYWIPPDDPLDSKVKCKIRIFRNIAKREDKQTKIKIENNNAHNYSLTLYLSFKSKMKYYGFSDSDAINLE